MVRHRLSLAGNRKLNYALHMVAVCQARSDALGGTYSRKKMAEGNPQGGSAVLKAPRLRRCLQKPRGGFAGAFAQRSLTKRSLQCVQAKFAELTFHALR